MGVLHEMKNKARQAVEQAGSGSESSREPRALEDEIVRVRAEIVECEGKIEELQNLIGERAYSLHTTESEDFNDPEIVSLCSSILDQLKVIALHERKIVKLREKAG